MNDSSKANLLNSKISPIKIQLNGKYRSDKKSVTEFTSFRATRYLLILYYAVLSPTFSYDTIKHNGKVFFNFYKLEKVAKILKLDYDRTHSAQSIYNDFKEHELVEEYTLNNKTYFTISENGKFCCINSLDELLKLMERDVFTDDEKNTLIGILKIRKKKNFKYKKDDSQNSITNMLDNMLSSYSVSYD